MCFFNVLEKEIVARTPFPAFVSNHFGSTRDTAMNVIACSSLYHVLFNDSLLLQNGNMKDLRAIEELRDVDRILSSPHFSPNGRMLLFFSIFIAHNHRLKRLRS